MVVFLLVSAERCNTMANFDDDILSSGTMVKDGMVISYGFQFHGGRYRQDLYV